MNRIELAATHQTSSGTIESLAAVPGAQLISCTPAAFVATLAAAFIATFGGFEAADTADIAVAGADRLDALSSSDLVTTGRVVRSSR